MLDQQQFGKRIQERRKAQGFTQEQLGGALGVSAQAVSKWENGESAPDIGLLPAICQLLGTSADGLLGIDGGVGLETLTDQLVARLSQQTKDARKIAIPQIIQRLHFMGYEGNVQSETMAGVVSVRDGGRLIGQRLWLRDRFSGMVFGEGIEAEPDAGVLETLRAMVAPVHWEIVQHLLQGPKKESALREAGLCPHPEALHTVMEELMDAGVVVRQREGYALEMRMGLSLAAILRALCAPQTGPAVIVRDLGDCPK